MSYKNHNWQVVATDYNSSLFHNYIWISSFFKYEKIFGVSRPVLGIIGTNEKIYYIAEIETWEKTHNELTEKIKKNIKYFEDIIDRTNSLGEKFNKWSYNEIYKKDIKNLNNEKLLGILDIFTEKQSDLCAHGTVIPMLDFQNFSFIEDNLRRILKEKLPKEKRQKYFDIFTAPTHNSFAQDQEEDLLRLFIIFYDDKKASKDIAKISTIDLKYKYPQIYKKLKKHTEKYAWVYYAYSGPAWREENFLEALQIYIRKNINPRKKLEQLKKAKERRDHLKKKYAKNLDVNKFDKEILFLTGKIVWAKPRRKDYQSQSYYHSEKLLKEIGRRTNLSLAQVRSIPLNMIKEYTKESEAMDVHLVNDMGKYHATLPNDDGTVSILYGKKAHNFWNKSVTKKEEKQIENNVREIKGDTAHKGRVKGRVKIINTVDDVKKMKQGNILVSSATNPSLINAMKKASAFITDEGGLACHASIVARELEKPCIVGTKIATEIFQDGDLVEVNANHGWVKKIIKNN